MNYKNNISYSKNIEEILHPNVMRIKKITSIITISIAWLLLSYDDRGAMIQRKETQRENWHIINEGYRTQLGECKTNGKAFWVNYKNPRILILEECSKDKKSSWKTIMVWVL
jgi:hypothetical protein